MTQHAVHNETNSLYEQAEALKSERPELRARDIAAELGISEGAYVAACVGHSATRLKDDAEATLKEIKNLGEVMALTRNDACVHERHGVYDNDEFSKHGPMSMGLFVNPDIDLRLFMDHWSAQFAVQESTKTGTRKSIQFFDKSGKAIHKIYLTSKSDEAAYDQLVLAHTHDQQPNHIEITEYPEKKADLPDSDIDWQGFRTAWEGLKDTHDFFPMLRKFKVGREQGFRHIGEDFAYPVALDSARKTLEAARDKGCEIMVFVGNRGCLQIHTGAVKKLLERGPWYNVLDPKFNLHLREDHIANAWVTKKPTEDGIVTALELFDKEGEIIATFFGKRKPGIPELTLWREIVDTLPRKA